MTLKANVAVAAAAQEQAAMQERRHAHRHKYTSADLETYIMKKCPQSDRKLDFCIQKMEKGRELNNSCCFRKLYIKAPFEKQ